MNVDDLKRKLEVKIADFGGRLYEVDFKMRTGKLEYLVILPGGHTGFIKITDGMTELSRTERSAIAELRTLGCAACVISSEKQIDRLLIYIMSDAGKDPAWHMFRQQNKELENESNNSM